MAIDNNKIKKIVEENMDLFEDSVKEDVPDFSRVQRLLDDVDNGTVRPHSVQRHRKAWVRWVSLAASVCLIAAIGILVNTRSADANGLKIFDSFTEFIGKFINIDKIEEQDDSTFTAEEANELRNDVTVYATIDEAKEKIDIPFMIPEYIPDEYKLRNVEYRKYNDNDYMVVYKFFKESTVLRIEQIKYGGSLFSTDNVYHSIEISGKKCHFIKNPNGSKQVIYHDDSRQITLIHFESDEEIIKVIENIKIYSR